MKKNRQELILEIIENNPVETQEELTRLLREKGCDVTQATVSRDVRNLMLVKVTDSSGRSVYSTAKHGEHILSGKMHSVYEQAFISATCTRNLVVVRTLSGMAPAVGAAIDSLKLEGVLGSIAGDDTLRLVCGDDDKAIEIEKILAELRRS